MEILFAFLEEGIGLKLLYSLDAFEQFAGSRTKLRVCFEEFQAATLLVYKTTDGLG